MVLYLKIHCHTQDHVDFFLCCHLVVLQFSIFHLGLWLIFFVCEGSKVYMSTIFFSIWISCCSSIIYLKDYLFSIDLPLLLCLGSVDDINVGTFDLLVYSFINAPLSWILSLYSKPPSWGVSALQLCSSPSELCGIFWLFFLST